MAKIGYNKIALEGFLQFLNSFPSFSFAIFQTITDSFFLNYALDGDKLAGIPLITTEKGRVFNEQTEVRWICQNEIFHFTFLSEDDALFDAVTEHLQKGQNDLLDLEQDNEHKIILWGQRNTLGKEVFWFEKKIPKKLYYPVENKGSRVEIVIVEYNEKGNWNSKFYRFKEVCNV
jgi:hypothetical protein